MNSRLKLSVVALLAITSGCGGSNGSSSATPPPAGGGGVGIPPPPIGTDGGPGQSPPMLGAACGRGQDDAANGGLWVFNTQDVFLTERMRLLVAETGEFRWLPPDGWSQQIFGTLQFDGAQVRTTDAVLVVLHGLTWLETQYVPLDMSGELDELGGMLLEYDYPAAFGDNIRILLSFDACATVYERDSSLQALAGTYIAGLATFAIDEQGAIFYQGGSCTGNGRAEVIDPDFNMYRMAIEVESCSGNTVHAPGRLFEGLAYLSDSSDISTNDVLEFALSSANADSTLAWSQTTRK